MRIDEIGMSVADAHQISSKKLGCLLNDAGIFFRTVSNHVISFDESLHFVCDMSP